MPFPRLLHKFDGLAELQDMQYPERLDTIPEKTFDTRVPKRGNAAHNVFQPTTKHGRFNIANPHFIHIVPAPTPISLRKKAKGQKSKTDRTTRSVLPLYGIQQAGCCHSGAISGKSLMISRTLIAGWNPV